MTLSRREFLALAGASVAAAAWTGCGTNPGIAPTPPTTPLPPVSSYDLVIVGASPGGIMAAQIAARAGVKVCVIENLLHVGGMLGPGGLGVTDSLRYASMGGLTAKYFRDVAAYYNHPQGAAALYAWEPHVAEIIFGSYLDSANITVAPERTIASVGKSGARIASVTLDNGDVVKGTQWIDASYEGDLMAMAGVTYTVGREAASQYGETLAGHYVTGDVDINPWLDGGVNAAGGTLLPYIDAPSTEARGQADSKVMAYMYRATLSMQGSRVPFPMPAKYNPAQWEGMLRYILLAGLDSHAGIWSSGFIPNGSGGSVEYGNKFVMEDNGCFTDAVTVGGWSYPNATWATRAALLAEYTSYQQGWMYFVANDASVPASVRANVNQYGLAGDEFTDNGNWPYLLYIREGRRMAGQYVMVENDCNGVNPTKTDTVGIGQWSIDSHACDQNAAVNGEGPCMAYDGQVENQSQAPYELSLRSMLPANGEAPNLAVVVCLSASHIGFSAVRTEPSYMLLGEAAGTAAVEALRAGSDLAEADVGAVQAALVANGGILKM
jgi:hypothetical protein